MASKETQLIEKLGSHNYATWKFKVEMMLIREDLFDQITEDPPIPPTNEWVKKDRKARALINLFIEDSQIIHVKNLTSARDTWHALRAIHERTNLSSKLHLLRKLYSTKLEERGDMQKHITRILELVDRLKAIGEEINNSHISALFLCSLPSSYETLITALEARPEAELTPEYISSKLIDEYNRRRDNNDTTQNAAKAFHANKSYNFHKRESKYCSYCKLKNHNRSECWKLKHKSNDSSKFKDPRNKYSNNSSQLVYEGNQRPPTRNSRDRYTNNIDSVTSRMNNTALAANNNVALISSTVNNENWIVDSGSSSHITYDETNFTNFDQSNTSEVIVANGNVLTAYGSGEIKLVSKTQSGETTQITLRDVLYVPDLKANLFSVRKATQNGCKVTFNNNICEVSKNDKIFLEGKINNNLYELNLPTVNNITNAYMTNTCNNRDCITLWHRRMGHKNFNSINEMRNKHLIEGININNCKHEINCEACIKSKLSDAPYPKASHNRSTHILQLVHTDVVGPMQTPTIGGKNYILTFVDDYSRYTTVYLLTKKSEVFSKLKEYIQFTWNKFGKIPEILRSDNGGEYLSNEMDEYLKENGIHHQLIVPHCPSQNGTAERKNRTLIEMTRTMLAEANLHKRFWGEAVSTANYLQNRLPTKATNKTPYELWHGRKPNLNHLKVFGCKAYAYVHKSKRGKLDDKAVEGIFVGYDNNSKAYRVYVEGKNVTIARTVKFLENSVKTKEPNNMNSELESVKPETETVEIQIHTEPNDHPTNSNDTATATQPRRSERSNRGVPPDRLIYLTQHSNTYEPVDYNDVLSLNNHIDKQNWLEAMNEEMESLKQNNTFTLVDPPPGRKIIGSKWTYKIKHDSSGKVAKYKARLVAKGFTQKYGEDYYETFAPVVSHSTIRAFLAGAAHRNTNIHHIDIKTAFLHGELEEDLFMSQPDGYKTKGNENKVWKLSKAIYGLKQAARAWHLNISETLKKLSFRQCDSDPCMFKRGKDKETVYVIVYVDDILVTAKEELIRSFIDELSKEYAIKDLGKVNHYLGINIRKDNDDNYYLNQMNKIEELTKKLNLENSKPYSTPMEVGYLNDAAEENLLPDNHAYRQAIGALLYIATVSRPDITVATNILSRRNANPRQKDWNAVKRLTSYLFHTKQLELKISSTVSPTLIAYADADWAGDKQDRKSTSGNVFFIGNSPIHWFSKKQNCITHSSAEAEYMSAGHATLEIQWLINLLKDLDMPQNLPIKLYDDNQSCINMIQSPKHSSKTKHVDIKFHAIRQLVNDGIIELEYLPTKQMITDLLTKPLPKQLFVKYREKLLVVPDDT